MIIRNT